MGSPEIPALKYFIRTKFILVDMAGGIRIRLPEMLLGSSFRSPPASAFEKGTTRRGRGFCLPFNLYYLFMSYLY